MLSSLKNDLHDSSGFWKINQNKQLNVKVYEFKNIVNKETCLSKLYGPYMVIKMQMSKVIIETETQKYKSQL